MSRRKREEQTLKCVTESAVADHPPYYHLTNPSPSHPQILPGNVNTYSEVENVLQPVIFATKIRIYPYNQYERTVCLRVEVVGCPSDGE